MTLLFNSSCLYQGVGLVHCLEGLLKARAILCVEDDEAAIDQIVQALVQQFPNMVFPASSLQSLPEWRIR